MNDHNWHRRSDTRFVSAGDYVTDEVFLVSDYDDDWQRVMYSHSEHGSSMTIQVGAVRGDREDGISELEAFIEHHPNGTVSQSTIEASLGW